MFVSNQRVSFNTDVTGECSARSFHRKILPQKGILIFGNETQAYLDCIIMLRRDGKVPNSVFCSSMHLNYFFVSLYIIVLS